MKIQHLGFVLVVIPDLGDCELFQEHFHLITGFFEGVVLFLQHVSSVLLLLLTLVVLLLLLNPDKLFYLLEKHGISPHTEVQQFIPQRFWQDLLFVVREMNIEGHTESLSLLQQFCPKEVQKLFWEDPLKDPKRL